MAKSRQRKPSNLSPTQAPDLFVKKLVFEGPSIQSVDVDEAMGSDLGGSVETERVDLVEPCIKGA